MLLDDPSTTIEDIAATLSLLSRDRMQARAIDALWTEWRVDRQIEAVLDAITEDDAFVRLVAKRAAGLTAGEVRASLRRSGLRLSRLRTPGCQGHRPQDDPTRLAPTRRGTR